MLGRLTLRRGVLTGSAAAVAATAWALGSQYVGSHALADAAPAAPGLDPEKWVPLKLAKVTKLTPIPPYIASPSATLRQHRACRSRRS